MDIVERAAERFSADAQRIRDAHAWAKDLHAGQMRKTGEEYITHPVGALGYLLGLPHPALDADTVIATLLHDVVEDTPATLGDVEERFGVAVRRLVDAVTDPKDGSSREDRDAAHVEQIMSAAEDDPRVWLVRLADQLHNAETLGVHRPQRAAEIARMNLEIYVPLAERLGLSDAAERLTAMSSAHA